MSQTIREERTDLPTATEIAQREVDGWRLSAVEWRREGATPGAEGREVPYGLRVSVAGATLVTDPEEHRVLLAILAGLVGDRPLSEIAASLNGSGYRTREGERWTQGEIFTLLPRLVDVGPGIFRSPEWKSARREVSPPPSVESR